ncbi:MAG: hypothetical protein P4L53_23700 [Candidatus Obscuribacterales bacterium]|nr:hypothetical protein [Candidatus Obscuribacterales bacterium]
MTKKQIWRALAFLVFQTSMSVNLLPALAADDATNAVLVDLIRHSNIVNPSYKLTAAVTAGEALITTQCKPKATDADRKIEAVLIAKTAFESLPDNVQRVKLLLLDYDANDCSSIMVKRAEVKLFGSGGLTQKELLDSLEIAKTNNAVGSASSFVVDGPEQGARMLVLGRIEKLKSQGANVSGYMIFFKQIEDAAKAGDAENVKTKCAYLGEKLTDQEGTIKQFRTRTATATAKVAMSAAAPASTATVPIGSIASRFTANQISSADGAAIGIGMRQYVMSDKIRKLKRQGLNVGNSLGLCDQVQALLIDGNLHAADSILAQLEQRYGH